MSNLCRLRSLISSNQRYILKSNPVCATFGNDFSQKRNLSHTPAKNTQKSGLFLNSGLLCKPYDSRFPLKNGQSLFSGNSIRFMSSQTPETVAAAATATATSPTAAGAPEIIDLTTSPTAETVQSVVNEVLTNPVIQSASITDLGISPWWTPINWCVHYLDVLTSVFPWWGAIAVGTLTLRLAMFPLVLRAQASSAKLAKVMPEQAILQQKMNNARSVGDTMEFARLSNESMTLFKRHGVNPLKSMVSQFAQIPTFLTFFLTLRRLAYYPVQSMTVGGLWWFTDLTIPDPLYGLPLLTSLSLWLTLEMSFRAGMNPNQTPVIKYGMRVLPIVMFAFTYDFPSAILVYWFTNNLISMVQVQLLRQRAVREFFNIPQIEINTKKLDVNKKSFSTHFKDTMNNAKVNKLLNERKTLDEMTFKKSGIGPLKKTYSKNRAANSH